MERSILIVDDEENLLLLLERILSKEGFTVRTAINSDRALELLDGYHFDAVILDVNMYPVDGVTLLSEIKNRWPTMKVMMITGYPTNDTRDECLKTGASTYLPKPLDLQELKSVAHNLAGNNSQVKKIN